MSSRTRLSFDIKLNASGQTIKISISDPRGFQADNLALATWGSSVVLANLLHRFVADFQDITKSYQPVIELGAGTGLVGLSAAAIWRTSIILTDLPPLLPNIEANIKLNQGLLSQYHGSAICASLDWAKPDLLHVGESMRHSAGHDDAVFNRLKAKVLLAADTIYSEEHPELLVKVIKARLAFESSSRLILCYPLRVGYLDHIRDLWQRLEDAELECLEEGKESIDESWEEGTPYEWCVWRWKHPG